MLPVPARLTGRPWAFFLDVDGTLLDIADAPDLVRVDARVRDVLGGLERASAGAVALVSGRSIADLDALFAPLRLPAAGLHGAERRDAAGRLHLHPVDPRLDSVRAGLRAWSQAHSGTLVEDKGAAIALHYRGALASEAEARSLVERLVQGLGDGFVMQEGKCVLEIKPSGVSKATAIREFLDEIPFSGHVPVFVGDDITDEDGFEAVSSVGGLAIAVGDRPSRHARYRLPEVASVLDWLGRYVDESGVNEA